MTTKANVYEMVTDRIIAELEKGNIPWKHPWTGVRSGAYNRITKKPYSIINQILLKYSGEYATFKQWQDQEFLKDQEALNNLLKNKVTRRAYARQNHVEEESLNNEHSFTTLPNAVFYMMDTDENQDTRSNLQKEFDSIIDLR